MLYGEGERLAAAYPVDGHRPPRRRNLALAYLLLLLLGPLAAHRYYVGATGTGLVLCLLTVVSIVLSIVGVGLVGLIVVFGWLAADFFALPRMVADYNTMLAGRHVRLT